MTKIFKFRGDAYKYDSETKKAHPGDVVHVRIAGGGFVVGTVEANGFEEENFFVKNENGEGFHVWVAAGDKYTVLKPAITDKCDNVDQPSHYRQGRFETIEMIEDIAGGYDDGFLGHCVGTAVKYLARAPHKHESPTECLRKAEKYVQFAIERAKKMAEDSE